MIRITPILSQQAKGYDPQEVYFWLGLIVIAAVLLAVIALWLKKALTGDIEPSQSLGFTLSDLREMHAQGQLTDAEFEAAKAKMLARSRRAMDETAEKTSTQDNLARGDTGLKLDADDMDELPPEDESATDPGNAVEKDDPSADEEDRHPDKNGDHPA